MPEYKPPGWADWVIEKICADHLLEEIQGDLHEAFYWRLEEKGYRGAYWLFVFESFRSLRFSNIKMSYNISQQTMMYRNYIKTGWRFMKKNKVYSSLNIAGLAIGIAFCWLAFFYANDELSFDKHLPNHEQLFRIVMDVQRGDETRHSAGSSNAMSILFNEEVPEIQDVARIKPGYGLIRKGEEHLENSFLMADKQIVDYLDLQFVEGSANSFELPHEVLISESLAAKLDIRGKAVDQVISIIQDDEFEDFVVRGVFEDMALNNSVRQNMLIPFSYYEANAPERRLTQWFDINMNTLVKLQDPSMRSEAERKMNLINYENISDERRGELSINIKLQPISEIHLDDRYGHFNGIQRRGSKEVINLFLGIGIFCLLISMINYSNFSISLNFNRSREIALRKVIGAPKKGIFSQLITESILSSMIAGFIAISFMILILPYFADFVRKQYAYEDFLSPIFIVGALLILILISLVSGFYPAVVLSRFKVIKSLKGEQKTGSIRWITQTLLGIQFVIATIMIASIITVSQQTQYLLDFDTKVNVNNVLQMEYIPADESAIQRFVEELSSYPQFEHVAACSPYNGTGIKKDGEMINVRHLRIENDLLSLLEIDIIDGRNFDPALATDRTSTAIVNEALIRALGLESPIGSVLPFEYGDLKNPTIVGVVEDYFFKSAKQKVEPLVIYQADTNPLQSVYIKTSSSQPNMDVIESTWNKHFSPFPFAVEYLKEAQEAQFQAEQRTANLLTIGSTVSIFLAAIGLLGIVGLQLSQRMKEVSIRKVLGASVFSLYAFFGRRFTIIIAMGLSTGLVLGYFLVGKWLDNYPYHINFGAWIVGLTVAITASVALIAIVLQVSRIVSSNPIKYLRNE